ncbi:MAG: hypothetical protein ABI840_11205 [bacterium]
MKKDRIYIDTSVIGGCFDIEFEEWSTKLFDEFVAGVKIAIISDVTLDELSLAKEEVRKKIDIIPISFKEYVLNTKQTEELADKYIKEKVVTNKYYEDALHNSNCNYK